MNQPLQGLKILDFTTLLPGPFGTMMLADMGAEIIRIESPTRPDLVRFYPPHINNTSVVHSYLNRSKRSLALDLKKEESFNIIEKLIMEYDIIVEQFRPGVMDRLGVGYKHLSEINPEIIYCSITGYGQTGPYKDRAGHDLNYLSISGITSYNGRKESGPSPMAIQIADIAGGSYHGVIGILAAVIHRTNTGQGQHIDISMTDAAFSMHGLTAAPALAEDKDPHIESEILNGGTFYDCYETSDKRYISVSSIEPHFFDQLCDILELQKYKGQSLNPDMTIQREIKKDIKDVFKSRSFDQWNEIFSNCDCCVEPVLSFSEACHHPQIENRNCVIKIQSDNETLKQPACPIKFSQSEISYKFGGVPSGHHSKEILRELNYTDEEINELLNKKIIQ